MNPRMQTIKQQTRSVYQDRARDFDKERSRSLMEKPWLDRFMCGLPKGGNILDLGCGSGEPIAAYLIQQGFRLIGVDYAAAMIDIAKQRFPGHIWMVQDLRQPVEGQKFDGVISWNGLFHLSPEEQRQALPMLAQSVESGGNLMLTIGDREGEVTGTVAGAKVYHASLEPTEYQTALSQAGFSEIEFQAQDPKCGFHSVLLAKNKQA